MCKHLWGFKFLKQNINTISASKIEVRGLFKSTALAHIGTYKFAPKMSGLNKIKNEVGYEKISANPTAFSRSMSVFLLVL